MSLDSVSAYTEELAEKYGHPHVEAARLLSLGLKGTEVAKQLGVSKHFVSAVKCNPDFRPLLLELSVLRTQSVAELHDAIEKKLAELALQGLERLSDVLRPVDDGGFNDPDTLLRITQDALSRCGHPPIASQKVLTTSSHAYVGTETVDRMLKNSERTALEIVETTEDSEDALESDLSPAQEELS